MSAGRIFVAASLLAPLLASACSGASAAPDVLLVTVDTLRADFLGAYGLLPSASPNLDALAERSVVFERAIAASPRTAPSHASIMTSRWVREHSIGWSNGSTRLEGHATLARVFREAGYATAAFVGNVMLARRMGFDDGFAVYDDELPDAEANRPRAFERIAEKTTRRAVAWLARERSQPRFLWVHYQDPHGPYTPPPSYAAPSLDAGPSGDRALPVLKKNRGEQGIPAYQVLGDLRRVAEYRSRYAGEIRYFDHWLGRLLEAFGEGAGDRVVLFTADHGESFGEDGFYFSHGFRTTPDQAWIPFVVYAPGLAPSRRPELVHHVDVMPTLLDLAGLPVPEDASGIALAALLREDEPLPERVLFSDVGFEVSAYREGAFFRAKTEPAALASGRVDARRFPWPTGGGWERGTPDSSLDEVIRAYAAIETSRVPAVAPDEPTVERLKALGYLDPDEDAAR